MPTDLMPLNATMTIPYVKLHTTTKLPPAGKKYLCFQMNGKSSPAAKCIKSRIVTKVIFSILSIDKFEQKYVFLKGMLQSQCLKYHMNTIVIDQSVSNGDYLKHKCLNNIKIYINMLVSVMKKRIKYII